MKRTPEREGIVVYYLTFVPLLLMLSPFLIIAMALCSILARFGNSGCQQFVSVVNAIYESHRQTLQRA